MIDFWVSPPNSSSYSWRMSILCFVPLTMTSSLTGSKGMDMSKSILAKADATFNFSKDADADAVVVLCWFVVQASIVGGGTCVLMTRFLCTLSLIFCSNEQVVHVNFGGKVGRGLVTKRRINSKGVQSDRDGYKNKTVAHQIGSQVLAHYILTVGLVPAILQSWPLHPLATLFRCGSGSRLANLS